MDLQIPPKVTPRAFERLAEINEVLMTEGPQQPRIRPGVAVAIVRDCLEALAAMHRQNIVHGDVKPQNLVLVPNTKYFCIKLIDFGSAEKMNTQREALTVDASSRSYKGKRILTPRSCAMSLMMLCNSLSFC